MNEEKRRPRNVALQRFMLIAPLLEPGLDQAELRYRRREIVHDYEWLHERTISDRTIRRYLGAYRKEGFDGLYPKTRKDAGKPRAMPTDVLDAAAILKAELPERSISRIIEILEGEGKVKPDVLRPSTVARHMKALGLMRLPRRVKPGLKRFRKEHRNMLWQADLKYGPYLPDPKDPKKTRRTYLLAFIDDCTRLVPHAQFYFDQKLPILEDCFKKAILKRGIPDKIFVDNGKIFVSRWFRIACARLNIRHLTAAPFAPEAKGKIERFMGTVDQFLAEIKLLKPKTLQELNEAFGSWLEEGYNHKGHSALEQETPAAYFAGDSRPIRFATAEELREAFLWEEDRKVDATGCIKYRNKLYDVGPDLAGQTIEIRFDPFAPETIEVWLNGKRERKARELVLNQERPTPATQQTKTPDRSRYLDLLSKQAKERRKKRLGAISYRDLEGDGDV